MLQNSVSPARVLVIAGSDSGSAAGIQADLKTIMKLGGYATTAIAALTAQNTRTITGILPVPSDFLAQQVEAVLGDIGADAIKVGMLYSVDNMKYVATLLSQHPYIPSVIDPVIRATTGASLTQDKAAQLYRELLIPVATLVTPNVIEAEILWGHPIKTVEDMQNAALSIYQMGAKSVLVKGGHLPQTIVTDVLYDGHRWHLFTGPRITGKKVHGTGCTLASAIACFIAQRQGLTEAVQNARRFVVEAINQSLAIGSLYAPLNHAVQINETVG